MKRFFQVVGALFLTVFGLLCISTMVDVANTPTGGRTRSTTPRQPIVRTVKYEVRGTKEQMITYKNASGGTAQVETYRTPWTHEFKAYPGTFVYLSSQAQVAYGYVKTNIYVDTVLWKTSTSSGSYVIASVSGAIP